MSGKPPARRDGPVEMNLPKAAQASSYEAFKASVRGDHAGEAAALDKFQTAVKTAQSEGIASGLYPRASVKKMEGGKTRRNKTSGGDIVSHLLTIRNQVKLYHWQTGSFARHKATDDLTATLDTNIDAFVESYMGRYGRPKVTGSIKLHNFTESAAKTFVSKETKYLQSELPKKIGKDDTDLLNLRDTILGDLTKVSYLFTLA